MIKNGVTATLLLFVALCMTPGSAGADQKLYFKDGSYQLVGRYEVQGDRVRYYSVERSQWEEIPASLVDFDATERVKKEEGAQQHKQLEEAKALDKERFERRAEDQGFEVAPGVHLPKQEGVFAFDGTRVIRMVQSSADLVTDKKRAVLTMALPAPVLKGRKLAVLAGDKAAVRIFVDQPTFYVQLPEGASARVELMSVKPVKEARVLERVEQSSLNGKSSESRAALPLERTEVAPGLFKLRPTQPLGAGEYALGELVADKLNLDVWDFGIGGADEKSPLVSQPDNPSPAMSEHPPTSTSPSDKRPMPNPPRPGTTPAPPSQQPPPGASPP